MKYIEPLMEIAIVQYEDIVTASPLTGNDFTTGDDGVTAPDTW